MIVFSSLASSWLLCSLHNFTLLLLWYEYFCFYLFQIEFTLHQVLLYLSDFSLCSFIVSCSLLTLFLSCKLYYMHCSFNSNLIFFYLLTISAFWFSIFAFVSFPFFSLSTSLFNNWLSFFHIYKSIQKLVIFNLLLANICSRILFF